jgi:predicted MPP superfamily phosphohydrolase
MPLRILTISDLHLDHEPDWAMPTEWPDFDVAVFAGDISGSPAEGMKWLRSVPGLEYCEIVFVAGNHEYYGREIEKEEERAIEAAQKARIHFLNPGSAVIEGTRFIGATLWTDYSLYGDRPAAMAAAGHAMNDHRLIKKKWDGTTAKFLPRDALARHQRERAWLEGQLAIPHSGPTVVVTHHGVGHESVHPRFAGDPVTPAFSSDMTALIESHPEIALWIHGHTHDGFDYSLGSTRVVCNPKGYGPHLRRGMPKPENPLFHPTKVVEVQQPDLRPTAS